MKGMRGSSPALVGLLWGLALLTSGCVGGTDPGPSPAEDGFDVVTDPRDTAYLANATPGSHVHDYWNGRERVEVIAGEGNVWSTCTGSCADGMAGAWRRPQEGVIVPQGTLWVNGTFTYTPDAESTARTFELWVKTAADAETARVQELVPGEPFAIEVAQDEADPPHYVLSLWQFEVVAKNVADEVSFRGAFTWSVEAVRGRPLVPYPPHPDRWDGATELTLLEDGADAALYYEQDGTRACYAGNNCMGDFPLPDGVVVPHDAARVEVRVSGTFLMPSVSFHGADTWSFASVPGRLDGADTVFDIPLGETLGDSPYASQSLWEFSVGLDQPTPTEAASGTYAITVRAFR